MARLSDFYSPTRLGHPHSPAQLLGAPSRTMLSYALLQGWRAAGAGGTAAGGVALSPRVAALAGESGCALGLV